MTNCRQVGYSFSVIQRNLELFFPSLEALRLKEVQSRFFWRWMFFSLALHLVAAKFSIGYHAADEHFQILEFLGYKLGLAPVQALAVEYRELMRSWVQVGMYWGVVQGLKAIGIQNHAHWAFGIRLFTGLIGWFSLVALGLCSRTWFKDLRAYRFAIISLAVLWFLPVLHVRPSSEGLGGSVFVLGLSLAWLQIQKDLQKAPSKAAGWKPSVWLGIGALLGFSFEFRFQMGLMIFGFLAWLLFLSPSLGFKKKTALGWTVLGLGAIFILGRGIDFWGYGEWCLSPWNYFRYNLIRGEVNRFGQSPWWDVFRMAFTESWPLLGIFVVVSTVIAWIRHPKHILTWAQVPFFLIHEWIPHKELRFFFPIISAAPILLTLSLYSERTQSFFTLPPRIWRVIQWPWKLLVLNNSVALIALLFIPLARSIQFYEAVDRLLEERPPNQRQFHLYTQEGGRDPYEILGSSVYFYRPSQFQLRRYGNFEDLAQLSKTSQETFWFYYPSFEMAEQDAEKLYHCKVVFRTLPEWVKWINFNHWVSRTNIWALYQCEGQSN